MYIKKDRKTLVFPQFNELFPFGGILNQDNRWLKLAALIPWDEIEDEYAKHFSDIGRPALDGRLVTGALCIKHKKKISDEEVQEEIQESPYLQAFCGLDNFTTDALFNRSSLSKLRKRLGEEYFKKLEKGVLKILRKHHLINIWGVMVDATVFPSSIRFPTDIWLLNEVRMWLEKHIKAACKSLGIEKKTVRTYPRRAKKDYLNFAKKKRKGKKAVRAAKKKMLGYVKRNLGHMEKLVEELKKSGTGIKKSFSEKHKTAQKIYEQQNEMYEKKTQNVKDRIVSFCQPWVRPVVRGKTGRDVEFGQKAVLSHVDGYGFLDYMDNNNFNEGVKLGDSIEAFEKRFGKKPKDVTGDQIYGNRENRRKLKEAEIKAGFKPLGRKAQTEEGLKQRKWVKKKQKKRSSQMEGIIGHAKVHYGLDRIGYKTKEGERIWARLSLLMMNLDTAVKRR